MKANGRMVSEVEKASIAIVYRSTIMKENGSKVRKKAMVTWKYKISVSFKEHLPTIIDLDMEQSISIVVTHTKDSMIEESSMEKEFMFGDQAQALKVTLFKESNKGKENGDPSLDKLSSGSMSRIRKTDLVATSGRMGQCTKDNFRTINSTF